MGVGSAVWAGLGVSVTALRTDEKSFVVKEASGGKESAAARSERAPRCSGQTCRWVVGVIGAGGLWRRAVAQSSES